MDMIVWLYEEWTKEFLKEKKGEFRRSLEEIKNMPPIKYQTMVWGNNDSSAVRIWHLEEFNSLVNSNSLEQWTMYFTYAD